MAIKKTVKLVNPYGRVVEVDARRKDEYLARGFREVKAEKSKARKEKKADAK